MRHKNDRQFLRNYIEKMKFISDADEHVQRILEDIFFVEVPYIGLRDMEIIFKTHNEDESIKQFCTEEKMSYEYSDFTNEFTIRVNDLLSCLERLDSKELIQTTLMQDEIAANESIDDRLTNIENMLIKILKSHSCERDCCCDTYDYTDSW